MGAPENIVVLRRRADYMHYINLRYKANGRERAGLDCWGLVRLILLEQHGIELPLYTEIDARDGEAVAQAMHIAREGWQRVDKPQAGDVVLMRIAGADGVAREQHVGLVTRPGWMIHIERGQRSCMARLDSILWRERIVGYFRYTEGAGALSVKPMVAMPHALRTQRIEAMVRPGVTLLEIHSDMVRLHPHTEAWIAIDNHPVPRSRWAYTTVPANAARIEYRALPGNGATSRLIGQLAIMAAVSVFAPPLAGAVGITSQIGTAALGFGLNMAGSLLWNAIFPVQQPQTYNYGTPKSMLFLQGATNQANRYGPFSCPLGRFRFTPPLAANSYSETIANKVYLRLQFDIGSPGQLSNITIGATPVSKLKEVEFAILTGLEDTDEDLDRFNRIAARDVEQISLNVTLNPGDDYVTRSFASAVDEISITLNNPQGLYQIPVEGSKAGKRDPSTVKVSVQVRQVGAADWNEVAAVIPAESINLSPAWYNIDDDAALEKVYRWTRISLDKFNNIITRDGAFSTTQTSGPNASMLERLQQESFGLNNTFERLPAVGQEEELLWDVCVYGNDIVQTIDRRGTAGLGSVSGCEASTSGRKVSIASGTIARAQSETLVIKKNTADPFSTVVKFRVPHGVYEVRAKRTDGNNEDFEYPSGNDGKRYNSTVLQAITGYTNQRPFTPGTPRCRLAMRVLATNQLNGTLDGVTVTWQGHYLDYDSVTDTWIRRATINPASIVRYLIQGPEYAHALTDDEINLDDLADFHTWCRDNGFTYEAGPLSDHMDFEDKLREVCAAGRASPTERDGKWTVAIDRPRTDYVDCFTPFDSWGFSFDRTYPVLPHAIRVQFINREAGYQPDEMIVYADGFNAGNATLFESWSYPGVCLPATIYKHARFQLACLILRSERFTASKDWSHFKATRGDLVLATHPVPKFGLGSGRVDALTDAYHIALEQPIPMEAGEAYIIRIWADDGTSVTREIVPVGVDEYYYTVEVYTALTDSECPAGNVFQFGTIAEGEAELLVVEGITPGDRMTAEFEMTAYAPAVYDADTGAIPAFESNVSLPAGLNREFILAKPVVTSIVSDEAAIRSNGSAIEFGIRVNFEAFDDLPSVGYLIEGQIQASGLDEDWKSVPMVPTGGGLDFPGVSAGSSYDLRFRYFDPARGAGGGWSDEITHTVVGLSDLEPVENLQVAVQNGISKMMWSIPANGALIPADYEIRFGVSSYNASRVANTPLTEYPLLGDGQYWVAARYRTNDNAWAYSAWDSIVIEGAGLVQNVVATFDDAAQGWPGTLSNMQVNDDNALILLPAGDILSVPDILALDDVLYYGGISPSGSYTFPEDEVVDIGRLAACGVRIDYTIDGLSLYDDFLSIPDILAVADILNGADDAAVYAQPQIATAGDDGVFGAWQNLVPGLITARYFKARLLVFSTDVNINAIISALTFSVDVPDRLETYVVQTSSSAAVSVTYAPAFNGGPGDTDEPLVQGTIIDAQPGDDLIISSQTASGCLVEVKNGGGRVVRNVNIMPQGY